MQQGLPFPFPASSAGLQVTETKLERFTGPVPPPEMLVKYESVQLGMADRLVSMAEREQQHRHKITELAVQGTIDVEKRGQWMALTVALAVLVVAVVLGVVASPWAGTIIGALDLAAVVGLFLKRERDEKKDDQG